MFSSEHHSSQGLSPEQYSNVVQSQSWPTLIAGSISHRVDPNKANIVFVAIKQILVRGASLVLQYAAAETSSINT